MKNTFLKLLKEDTSEIASIYYSLFSLTDDDDLDRDLEYLKNLSLGNDSYFKEWGIENWFYSFHKSIRQIYFFDGNYRIVKMELLTEEEDAEFKYLLHSFRVDKENKYDAKDEFTVRYRRFLELRDRKKREDLEESIDGRLDNILWCMIKLDTNEVLKTTMERVFKNTK